MNSFPSWPSLGNFFSCSSKHSFVIYFQVDVIPWTIPKWYIFIVIVHCESSSIDISCNTFHCSRAQHFCMKFHCDTQEDVTIVTYATQSQNKELHNRNNHNLLLNTFKTRNIIISKMHKKLEKNNWMTDTTFISLVKPLSIRYWNAHQSIILSHFIFCIFFLFYIKGDPIRGVILIFHSKSLVKR